MKCNKKWFRSKKSAHRFIKSYGRARKAKGIYMRAYKCPLCKGWHITSQEKQ